MPEKYKMFLPIASNTYNDDVQDQLVKCFMGEKKTENPRPYDTEGRAFLRSREGRELTQAEAAIKIGVSTGRYQNWEYGRNRPAPELFGKILQVLGLDVASLYSDEPLTREHITPIRHLREEAFLIDRLNVKATGATKTGFPSPDQVQVIDRIAVSDRFLGALPRISSPANLRVITAFGESMKPTVNPGDILIVDIGTKQTDIDGIYVLQSRGELYIKRIKRRPTDGKRFLISDNNPSGEPPEQLTGNEANVTLEGRVVWRWRGEAML